MIKNREEISTTTIVAYDEKYILLPSLRRGRLYIHYLDKFEIILMGRRMDDGI